MADQDKRRPIPSAEPAKFIELEFERDGDEVVISARSVIDGHSVGFVLRMPKDRASVLAVNAREIAADEPEATLLRCTLSRSILQVSQ